MRAPATGRSRLRRALRVVAGLALALLLAAAAGLVLVHSPAGRRLLRSFLESWASSAVGGSLRIGQLDLALWRGSAEAADLELRLPGTSIAVERIALQWSASGPRLSVLRPAIVVTGTARDTPRLVKAEGLAARPWAILERLSSLESRDGRLELRRPDGAPWLVLARLDLDLADGGRRVVLRTKDAAFGWPAAGLRVRGATAEAAASLDDGRLVVDSLRVASGTSSVELRGTLERILPLTATARGRVAVDGALVAALAPGAAVDGRLESTVDVEVVDDRASASIAAASPALRIARLGPWSVEARGRLDDGALRLDAFTARGYDGVVEAGGTLALGEGPTDLTLRLRGLDPSAVAKGVAGAVLPLSARAGGSLRVTTSGLDAETARAEGRLELLPALGNGLKPSATARVSLIRGGLELGDVRLQLHGARIEGDLAAGRDGSLRGRWTAELPLSGLPGLLADLGSEAPALPLEGRLRAEGDLGGTTSAPRATARVSGDGLELRGRALGLDAAARYEAGQLAVAPLVLRSGGGRATLTGTVPLRPAGEWALEGWLEAFELEPLLALASLEGGGPASGTLSVTGPRDEPVGRASLRALARLPRPAGADAPGPDEIVAELEAESSGRSVRVERLQLDLAGGRVTGRARFDASSGAIGAELVASGLAWDRLPLLPARARALAGTLEGRLSLAGTSQAPAGELRLEMADLRLAGASLPPVALTARSDGREVSVAGTWGKAGVLEGRARLEGDWPLQLELDASALPLQAIADGVAALKQARFEVGASGHVVIELPLRDPSRLRYASTDLSLSGRLRRLDWQLAHFSVRGSRDAVELDGFRLELGTAWLSARGRAALAPASPFDLELEGRLDLQALDPALPGRTFGGDGALKLRVTGTGEAPALDGTLRLVDVRGRYEGARFADLDVEARFVGRELRVERLAAEVLGGRLGASGGITLFGRAEAPPRFVFEAHDVDLARFLERDVREAAESPALLVSVEGELSADGPSLARASGRGRLTRFDSQSVEGALALQAPVAWTLAGGAFEAEPIRLAGPLGALEARVAARALGEAGASASAELAGRVDLRVLSPFLPETSVSGPATIDVRARYGANAWQLDGAVEVREARLSLDALNFTAGELAGKLVFAGDRVRVEATAAAGDGRLRASGELRPGASLLGSAELTLAAERVPISYPPGFRGRASGTLQLSGEPGSYRVTGSVAVRQGYYTAEFDSRSQSLDRLDWQLGALDGGSLSDQIALAVSVQLAEPVRIRNSAMTLDVEGAVAASGTLAQPVAEGTLVLREGGELVIGRARVRVSDGRIELNGYPARTPDLDFQGQTRVSGTLMDIRARGALDDLELTLGSDRTDLSQTDLVTLLFTGRTAADAYSQGGAVVAEQLAVALGGVLQKGVGETFLIDVAPDRSLLQDDVDPTQRLNVGARVTQNLSVVYSTALDGTEQRWIVEFNPGGGRFRVRTITEEDNSFSVEGSDRIAFDLWNRRSRARGAREIERLAALRFEGALPVPEHELRGAAKLKLRGRYSVLQREQAADRVRERLVRAGYRSASVDATSRPGQGGVELVLRVDPGPLVRVVWSGDDPGGKTKQEAEKAFSGVASPDAAAAQVARVALFRLQAEGHYGASVTSQATVGEGRVDVALRAARGPKGTSVAVDFDGNRALSDEALRAVLPEPGSLEFFEALDPRSARIGNAVRLAYAGIGYLRARVQAPRSAFDSATGRLTVTIPVRERTAATVTAIQLPGDVTELDAAPPELKLRQGQPFDLSAYVADRDALGAWYRAQGYVEAQANASLEARGGSVTVRFDVDRGPRPRIGSIRVVDTGNTSSALIRRSLYLREGDYLQPEALARSRERLSDTGIVPRGDLRSEPRAPDGALRDVVVGLVHKPDVQLEYGLRYTTSGSASTGEAPSTTEGGEVQAAGAIELNNVFGYGVKARAYSYLGTSRTTWGLTFDAATLAGLRVRTQLFVFDDDDDLIDIEGLDSRVRGVSFLQSRVLLRDRRSRRWHDRLRLQWGYSHKTIDYLASEGGEVLPLGVRGFIPVALIGDERDSLTDPRRGVFWTATSEFARTWLGSDVDYVRLYGQFFAYLPLGPLVWAQGYRAGIVPGENTLLLIENRFRAGGPTTVRGFEQNAVGPQTPGGLSLGGQAVAVFNQELRFPIFGSLKGGVFWDSGNTWITAKEWSLGDLRHSVGVGLRYMFPFGPIRLEYAWIVDHQPGEPRGRIVFGLGHAF